MQVGCYLSDKLEVLILSVYIRYSDVESYSCVVEP